MKTIEAVMFNEDLKSKKVISLVSNNNETRFNILISNIYANAQESANSHPLYHFPIMVGEKRARQEYDKLKKEYSNK